METQYTDSLNAFNLLINMTVVLVAVEGIYYNILYTTLFHHINDSILCNDITAGPDE